MQKVKNAEWFCPRTVMDHCHNLGLVIDLTDTFRYYHPEVCNDNNNNNNKK
ncbi:hypothetical protein E2C01_095543 [Portunus trituberculatus]|uniref:Uncharacterized protein n=1 Tax=Portunus trituberculatus TaxID=210409 RepID=A0A5B7JVJ3_PORTR|nr:hypothetical protein [Portunus trituberculatus]